MTNSTLLLTASFLLSGITLTACEYYGCDHEDPFCDDHNDSRLDAGERSQTERSCANTCDRLTSCGRVPAAQHASCVQACASAFAAKDFSTQLFSRCAQQTTCSELAGECGPVPATLAPAAPPPPPSMPTYLDAGASSCAIDASAPDAGCRSHAECARVEACVEGVCRARCDVSCDCPAGNVCSQGSCFPTATPTTCSLSGG
jgi:hypothetical protein